MTLAILPFTSACYNLLRTQPQEATFAQPSYRQASEAQPATESAKVKVIWSSEDGLPAGMHFSKGAGNWELRMRHGYPTADDPHQLLGYLKLNYTWKSGSASDEEKRVHLERQRSKASEILKAEAAKVGGNAIIVKHSSYSNPSMVKGGYAAVVVNLSDAAPVFREPDEMLADLRVPDKYSKGKQLRLRLEDNPEFTLPGAEHKCYFLGVALDEDAKIHEAKKEGVRLEWKSDDPEIQGRYSGRDIIYGWKRYESINFGCGSKKSPIKLSLVPRSEELETSGEGEVVVQVYERTQSKDELRRIEEANRRRLRRGCVACVSLLNQCSSPGLCRPYQECLRKHHVTHRICEELGF
jgi:hypothetical protein